MRQEELPVMIFVIGVMFILAAIFVGMAGCTVPVSVVDKLVTNPRGSPP